MSFMRYAVALTRSSAEQHDHRRRVGQADVHAAPDLLVAAGEVEHLGDRQHHLVELLDADVLVAVLGLVVVALAVLVDAGDQSAGDEVRRGGAPGSPRMLRR
jgi:hypothetical protein